MTPPPRLLKAIAGYLGTSLFGFGALGLSAFGFFSDRFSFFGSLEDEKRRMYDRTFDEVDWNGIVLKSSRSDKGM